jgi:hypothetical protein
MTMFLTRTADAEGTGALPWQESFTAPPRRQEPTRSGQNIVASDVTVRSAGTVPFAIGGTKRLGERVAGYAA